MKSWHYSLIEGTFYSLIGLVIVATAVNYNWPNGAGLFYSGFASRWSGACTGWTKSDATWHLIGSIQHWWAYCTISIVFARQHPALRTVRYSFVTLALVAAFIMGCGIGHLCNIYTILHPAYRIEGLWLTINGTISDAAVPFVAYSLHSAFCDVRAKRVVIERQLEELKSLKSIKRQ